MPGLPEFPRPKEFIEKLVSKGYNVVYLRYNGTFESSGRFLNKNITKNILDLINSLKKEL